MCDIQPRPFRQVGGTNKRSINDLSDEILLQIFSHITPPALLLSTLTKVCLRWKRLCSDFSLYRTLIFQAADPELSIAVAMIRGAPWLRSIELNERGDVNDILSHLAECCPLLEKLVISHCRGSSESLEVSSEHLRQVMTCCTKLHSWSLESTYVTEEYVYEEIGSKLPLLTSINFGCIDYYIPYALMAIANHCVGIEEIRITTLEKNIDENVILILCENFSESLRILVLKFFPEWSDAALELLTECQKLEHIYLHSANKEITEDGLKHMGIMTNIKHLELDAFESISSQVWVDLLRSPNMRNLQVLDMDDCNVNDDVLSAISVLPNIEKLVLQGHSCKFTDKGLLSISDIPKLVELFLDSCYNITSVGWKKFVQKLTAKNITRMYLNAHPHLDDSAALAIMEHLRRLKKLTLADCSKLSRGVVTTLKEQMQLCGCDCTIN